MLNAFTCLKNVRVSFAALVCPYYFITTLKINPSARGTFLHKVKKVTTGGAMLKEVKFFAEVLLSVSESSSWRIWLYSSSNASHSFLNSGLLSCLLKYFSKSSIVFTFLSLKINFSVAYRFFDFINRSFAIFFDKTICQYSNIANIEKT